MSAHKYALNTDVTDPKAHAQTGPTPISGMIFDQSEILSLWKPYMVGAGLLSS